MQNRNIQPESGTPHGNLSAVLTGQKSLREILPPYRLSPEQLADILDEPHTRRAWWLDLHSGCDLSTGTTINDVEAAVGRTAGSNTATDHASNGQPAAAPISLITCLRIDHAHTIDEGCWDLRPFEERRAEVCQYALTGEQRRDFLEAL